MNSLVLSVAEAPDLLQSAAELHEIFCAPENDDIALEFPGTLQKLRANLETAQETVQRYRDIYTPGSNETFIAYTEVADDTGNEARLQAAGLAFTRMLGDRTGIHTLNGINAHDPNVSLIIAHPFRGEGLGRLLLSRQLASLREHNTGRAWATVRDANIASAGLVASLGFKRGPEIELLNGAGHYFTYSD